MVDEKIPNERERVAAMPQMCVNSHLRKAARIVSSFYDGIVGSSGLHGNQLMLLVPPYLAGSIRINNMAEKIGLDRTTLVRNLKLIEEKGLVTITPGKDQRMRIVTLTARGRDILVESLPLWEEAQNQVIEVLGSQHSVLMNVLNDLSVPEKGV